VQVGSVLAIVTVAEVPEGIDAIVSEHLITSFVEYGPNDPDDAESIVK
jgi:propanediol dehydratase large subunit